jgi:ribosomal protein L29
MTKKTKELRSLPITEMEEKMYELKQALSKEKSTLASGTKTEKPGKIKQIKKNIARIHTILQEKKNKKTEVKKANE